MLADALKTYRDEVLRELKDDILEFWLAKVLDFPSGGFHGAVNGQGIPDPTADKGVILATRILWTYSRAWSSYKDERYLQAARLMYRYLLEHFVDQAHGGVYWMLDAQGRPLDPTKKFYAQAFAVYALAEYHRATDDSRALAEAMTLFRLLEAHGRDPRAGGYLDALGRDWAPVADTRLSSKDLNTPKTMNTNLHVLEAYSTLVLCTPDPAVKEALRSLTRVFFTKILRPDRHFGLFFDLDWNEVSGETSYGHDIEGSWLLTEAAHASGDKALIERAQTIAVEMAQAVLVDGADAEGSVLNERRSDGTLHPGREWWVQTEGMVGYFNAYQASGNEVFAQRSLLAWDYCKQRFLRPDGEWYSNLKADGTPDLALAIAGPWKCPYHNARACFEVAERITAGR